MSAARFDPIPVNPSTASRRFAREQAAREALTHERDKPPMSDTLYVVVLSGVPGLPFGGACHLRRKDFLVDADQNTSIGVYTSPESAMRAIADENWRREGVFYAVARASDVLSPLLLADAMDEAPPA